MTLVKSIMQRDLVSAGSTESVADAVARLGGKDVGALLVLDDGRISGILSERDVLRRVVGRGLDPARTEVGEVATREPTVVRADASIKDCADLIRDSGFRHLPIVDGDQRPVGIISSRDLLQFVVEGLERYIEHYRAEQHREEMIDPYSSFGSSFDGSG